MTKEERKQKQERELQAFRKVEEAQDVRQMTPQWKLSITDFLDCTPMEVFMMLLTFFALYGADMGYAYGDKSSDEPMGWLNFVTMIIFLLEWLLNSIARPLYVLRTNFWLDLLAAVSLIGDIPMFADALLPSGFAAARAGRAARAGSKAGRLIRLVRLTRLVRLVRLVRIQKYMKNKQRVSVVDQFGTDEERAILAKMRARRCKGRRRRPKGRCHCQHDVHKDDQEGYYRCPPHAPCHAFLDVFTEDMSAQEGLTNLHILATTSGNLSSVEKANLDTLKAHYLKEHPNIFILQVNGEKYLNDQAYFDSRRGKEMTLVFYPNDEDYDESTTLSTPSSTLLMPSRHSRTTPSIRRPLSSASS